MDLKIYTQKNQMMYKAFICFNLLVFSFSLLSCNKENNENNDLQISQINMEEVANRYLKEFNVRQKPSNDSLTKEYIFTRNTDSAYIFITVRIHNTSVEAENFVNKYIDDISLHMEEGPYQEIIIGNKYWWWAPNSDFNNVTNLVFIRKNVVFIMSSQSYDIKTLAKKIDDDIVNKESYITFSD
jgi:hypothetical protein